MIRNKKMVMIIVLASFLLNGCAYRLIDNITVVNTKSENTDMDTATGKAVEGKVYYPYLIGYNFQDAIDEAFENAGPAYDMLVNTTIDVKYYYVLIYFSKYVIVKGTAVESSEFKKSMGETKYNKWLANQNVIYRSKVDLPAPES